MTGAMFYDAGNNTAAFMARARRARRVRLVYCPPRAVRLPDRAACAK